MAVPVLQDWGSNNSGGNTVTTLDFVLDQNVYTCKAGDIQIIIVGNDDTGTTDQFTTTESGWERLVIDGAGGGGVDAHIAIFGRVATGTAANDHATITITGQASNEMQGIWAYISGAHWPGKVTKIGTDSVSPYVLAAETVANKDWYILGGLSFDGGDGTDWVSLSPYTLLAQVNSGTAGTDNQGIYCWDTNTSTTNIQAMQLTSGTADGCQLAWVALPASINIDPTSVPSAKAVGTPALTFGVMTISANSVETLAAVGGSYNLAETFYFDASDSGPTGADWTNGANAFDSDESTYASISVNNSILAAGGTTAPTTGLDIFQAEARIKGQTGFGAIMSVTVFSAAQDLAVINKSGAEGYSDWVYLPDPTGGWTWQKISDLRAEASRTGGVGADRLHHVQVRVITYGVGLIFSGGATTISVNSLAAAAAVGTHALTLQLSVSADGVAAVQAVGTPAINFEIGISATSVASVKAVGTHALALQLTLAASSVNSAKAVGTHALTMLLTVSATSLVSAKAVGTPGINFSLGITATSVAAVKAVGTPALSQLLALAPVSLASVKAVGSPTVALQLAISATSVAAVKAVGTPAVSFALQITPTSLASAKAIGTPALTFGTLTLAATSVAAAKAVNTPAISFALQITASSLASAKAVNTPAITFGALAITATSVASARAIQAPAISFGVLTLAATSLASAKAVGQPTIDFALNISANSVASASAVGTHALTLQLILVHTSLASARAVGTPGLALVLAVTATSLVRTATVSPPSLGINLAIAPPSIASQAAVALSSLTMRLTITATSVASAKAVGTPAAAFVILLQATSIATRAAVTAPALNLGALALAATSVASARAVQSPTVALALAVTPNSVASAKAIQAPALQLTLAIAATSVVTRAAIATPFLAGQFDVIAHRLALTAALIAGPGVTAGLPGLAGIVARLPMGPSVTAGQCAVGLGVRWVGNVRVIPWPALLIYAESLASQAAIGTHAVVLN